MTEQASAKKIELWPLSRLLPYERNARTHSPEQVAQIAASIQEFGFTNPILVDGDDGILAGHGRLAAAKDLGLTQVPVIVLDHLTEAQRRAYVIADNKLALNAGWDVDMLAMEVEALREDDFNLDLLGFSEEELKGLTEDGWASDIEEAVEKHGENTDGIEGKIVIRCQGLDRDDLIDHLQRAIDESGIEGVSID
jgi:ParB-like chromosome segregation protein Spo0J